MRFECFPITNGCWVCRHDGYLFSKDREMKPADCLIEETVYFDLPELLEDVAIYILQLEEENAENDKHNISVSHEIPPEYFYVDYDQDVGTVSADALLDEEVDLEEWWEDDDESF